MPQKNLISLVFVSLFLISSVIVFSVYHQKQTSKKKRTGCIVSWLRFTTDTQEILYDWHFYFHVDFTCHRDEQWAEPHCRVTMLFYQSMYVCLCSMRARNKREIHIVWSYTTCTHGKQTSTERQVNKQMENGRSGKKKWRVCNMFISIRYIWRLHVDYRTCNIKLVYLQYI